MNATELSTLVTAIAAVVSAPAVTLYMNRRKEKQQERARSAARERETAAGTEVSWEAINLALVKERDRATAALEVQRLAHTEEIAQMRERHRSEINSLRTKWEDDAAEMRRGLDREASEMKQRYDEELSKLSSRLADCQKTVNELYKKIFELQNRPPDARLTGNGAPGVT